MATKFTDRRSLLLSLPTHQHRLRHLKSVAVRNLILPKSFLVTDLSKLKTYFSLHADVKQKAFYESEVISGSLNPNFKGFDLSVNPSINTSSSYFVIRLWAGQQQTFTMVIEWIVDLSGLCYLGENIHMEDYKYKPNTLLYGMFDGYFGADEEKQILDPSSLDIFDCSVKVDQAAVKSSYSVNSLSRVLTVLRAVKQTQSIVGRVRHSIEDKLIKSRARSQKLAEYELLVLRVQQCRDELSYRTQTLQKLSDQLHQTTLSNHQLDIEIKRRYETLERDRDRLHEKRKYFFEYRENFIKTNSQLFIRRKQLISELAVIYPIQETEDHKFTICGVHLPNAEDFQGVDDTRINVALGCTAHLVMMICHFLDIRPRYEIEHLTSRSKIHDHIIERVPDNNREFPLHGRRKDRFRFNYAVFLLNKTIAQLRDYCGLGTKDLRLTLPNLKTLLELRLGVHFEAGVSSATYRRNLLSDRALLHRVGQFSSKQTKPLPTPAAKHRAEQSPENSSQRSLDIPASESPQRSRESSSERNDTLYKSLTPDYSPKTTSNGLSESEEDRKVLSSSSDNQTELRTWIGHVNGDQTTFVPEVDDRETTAPFISLAGEAPTTAPFVALEDDDENIDERVQALTERATSFKLAHHLASDQDTDAGSAALVADVDSSNEIRDGPLVVDGVISIHGADVPDSVV